MVDDPIHVISLGAGVQSTRVVLGAAVGEITPMPVAAVFADTGDEPASVYRHLEWLRRELPFPVIVTRRVPSISHAMRSVAQAAQTGERVYGQKGSPPVFVAEPDGSEPGMLPRQCTANWKIAPIEAVARDLAVEHFGEAAVRSAARRHRTLVVQWLGISTDEASRMKPARVPWIENRYPLAMELRAARHDCVLWMERRGYPPAPRSACWHCPYRSDAEWRRLRDEEPEDWQRAVDLDDAIRGGFAGMTRTRQAFLHRQRIPLRDVDLSDGGQMDLWGEECAGVCGV